jgi:hypothetical protein
MALQKMRGPNLAESIPSTISNLFKLTIFETSSRECCSYLVTTVAASSLEAKGETCNRTDWSSASNTRLNIRLEDVLLLSRARTLIGSLRCFMTPNGNDCWRL